MYALGHAASEIGAQLLRHVPMDDWNKNEGYLKEHLERHHHYLTEHLALMV